MNKEDAVLFRESENEIPRIWTINFDLDTKSSFYDYSHYSTIHDFLKQQHFEYRQHSGDISTCEMTSSKIICTLDDLYAKHPDIKACTKSCLFTSVDESYSFTDVRKEQRNTKPQKSSFTMHLDIKKNDARHIFNTTNPECLEGYIRDCFKYPSDLKDQMSYSIKEKANGSISIDWTSDMAISSLDKTIATNRIFAKYPNLLNPGHNMIFEITYGKNTTDLIAEQQRIMSQEKKRLVEYDMSTKKLGKKEYNNRNNMLKRRLAYFGLKPIQESGWISEYGMTDEQIQAILTELFREKCNYDKITEVMDISVISNDVYDYMKLASQQGASTNNNQSQDIPVVKNSKEQEFLRSESFRELSSSITSDSTKTTPPSSAKKAASNKKHKFDIDR